MDCGRTIQFKYLFITTAVEKGFRLLYSLQKTKKKGHSSTENNHLEFINKVKGAKITDITVVQLLQVLLALQVPES